MPCLHLQCCCWQVCSNLQMQAPHLPDQSGWRCCRQCDTARALRHSLAAQGAGKSSGALSWLLDTNLSLKRSYEEACAEYAPSLRRRGRSVGEQLMEMFSSPAQTAPGARALVASKRFNRALHCFGKKVAAACPHGEAAQGSGWAHQPMGSERASYFRCHVPLRSALLIATKRKFLIVVCMHA